MDHILNSTRIAKRLKTVGLSYVDANRYSAYALYQIERQGLESTISFFKKIGDLLLHCRFGTPEKPTWVKTKHGLPAALTFLKGYSDEVILRVAKFARSFRFTSTRDSQVSKILNAIIKPYGGSKEGLQRLSNLIERGVDALNLRSLRISPVQTPSEVFRTYKRTMSESGATLDGKRPPLKESFKHLANTPIMKTIPFRECFFPIGFRSQDQILSESLVSTENTFVGEYDGAQEGGGKLRGFASPYTIFQLQSSPIMDWIRQFHKVVKSDCTMDQDRGALWAQSKLNSNVIVHSVDLSTATCRFPLEPQIDMLRTLGLPENYISALEFMCRGKYRVNRDKLGPNFPETVSWVVGQPLGIKPSMAMFSLAHNLLLVGLCSELKLSLSDSFRVLGDDVALINDDLHTAYRDVMKGVDVPISENKCHSSQKFGEFAGYSITSTTMVRPGQWKEAVLANHLDLSLELGLPLKGEVQQSWLNAEKLHLFREGKFVPTNEQYREYLFRNSSLMKDELREPDNLPIKGYDVHCRKFISDTYPHIHLSFLPGDYNPVREIFKGLPLSENVLWWRSSSYDLDIDTFGTYQIVLNAHVALYNDLMLGVLEKVDFIHYNSLIFENALKLFWITPKSLTALEDSRTKQLIAAWKTADLLKD